MKCLLLANGESDFSLILEGCLVQLTRMTMEEAVDADIEPYDAYAVLADGKVLDPRLRMRLEEETAKGKKLFTECLNSWADVYSEEINDTTRRRLVVADENAAPGLSEGDLLDEGSNRMMRPWYCVPGMKSVLVSRERIVAHSHWDADKEELLKDSDPALWFMGDNVLMCSFVLHNFNKARFSPSESWRRLISFVAQWLTGNEPSVWPEPVVRRGVCETASDDSAFEACRKDAVKRGIKWLERYLVDQGKGGIREGLRHNIDPEGCQLTADTVRTDCSGEAAGAFRFFGKLYNEEKSLEIADSLSDFVFGPMLIKNGILDGMLRWTDTAWKVCYQDDVARAILPEIYNCLFFGNGERFSHVCRVLDFLVKTTAKDGCRVIRTDGCDLTQESIRKLSESEHGVPSAHYNAYYHASLLLAYKYCGNITYLETGRKGLETIMSRYPETQREQSETQEMCRLVLPLAVLYDVTGEKKHEEMLYRVTEDLIKHKHPSGGYREWDTDYKARFSRDSDSECSLLTHNGDPVADLLYSVNWLPAGFAYAYRATGDELFRKLWRDIAVFCMNVQISSDDEKLDGSWCRAFDMETGEAYGCPHDVGWAAKCSETGWTVSEILMGLMMPDLPDKNYFIS